MLERVIKTDLGRVKLRMSGGIYRGKSNYQLWVTFCEPKKRKFKEVVDTNCWTYRDLTMEDRMAFRRAEAFKFISKEQLDEFIQDFHKSIIPELPTLKDIYFN